MFTRTWCVAALLIVSVPAASQTVLSEADVLARLTADSPRARAIRAIADVARAEALGAGRYPNPRLSVDREAVAGVSETLTTVLQPLPITGRRALERATAVAVADATARRADDDVRRLRADLRVVYAELAAAQVRERELTRSREQLVELARILERREAAGDAAGFDRLRSEREVLDVEADLQMAGADRAHAQARLASFLSAGTDPSALVVADLTPGARELPPLEALVERAEQARGQLLGLQKDREAAQLGIQAADRAAATPARSTTRNASSSACAWPTRASATARSGRPRSNSGSVACTPMTLPMSPPPRLDDFVPANTSGSGRRRRSAARIASRAAS